MSNWVLKFDGVNDEVTFTSPTAIDIGTSTDWSIEFRIKIPVGGLSASLTQYVLGSSGSSFNGIYHRPASGTGALALITGGTFRIASAAGMLLADDQFHVYKIYKTTATGANVYFERDGVQFGSPVFYSTPNQLSVGRFGRGSSTGSGWFAFELDYCTYVLPSQSVNIRWEADLANGTGTVLPTVSGTNQGTLTNFTVPNCWIFYSAGSSFNESILKSSLNFVSEALNISSGQNHLLGKTSYLVNNNPLNINAGFGAAANKSSLLKSDKSFSVNVGSQLGVGKQSLILSHKNPNVLLGTVLTVGDTTLPINVKQLEIVVGDNLPFIGNVLKQSLLLTNKQLSSKLGWISGVNKSSVSVSNKLFTANTGTNNTVLKRNYSLNYKPLSVQTGTSVPSIALLNKSSLAVTGKYFDVTVGTTIPFIGLSGKTNLSLTGKQIFVVNGFHQATNKNVLSVQYKLLQYSTVIVPDVIEMNRLFTLKSPTTFYILKDI